MTSCYHLITPSESPDYEPSETLPNPTQFSPNPDEPEEPVTPEKDPIELSVFASKGEVDNQRVISVNAVIRNNSFTPITSLSFWDKLEPGTEYLSSTDVNLQYNSQTNAVIAQVETLNAGEEVAFTYSLRITEQNSGELTVRKAEIEYFINEEAHTQTTSMGFADASSLVESNALVLIPDQTGDGWEKAGRYSLYLDNEVLSEEAVVSITPADVPGDGPELQFDLELIETSIPETTATGELTEQEVTLINPVETAFDSPAYLEINLDGVADLTDIPADQEPYVATYDEENSVWVKIPILSENVETNSVTVSAAHFSTWGAGLGDSLPKNGANVLLFDQPYTSLFTGAARYSVPIWTPPGRAGMAPDVSLSYSSATVDGVLGDVQAPWVGVGWSIDGIEVVRKITTNENGYGYKNEFALTLNGAAYSLVEDTDHFGRYFTDHDSFLYIERHNYANGNATDKNGNVPDNAAGEWWEVVTTDGTRYRLGWSEDSEQLALMYGYKCTTGGTNCQTPNGAYATLGYAGRAVNRVAMRWRVDRVQDTHGNYITYSYTEFQPASSLIASFDKESYLDTISYTGHEGVNSTLSPAYQVHFTYGSRIGDKTTTFNIWDNVDSKQLDKIEVCYLTCSGNNIVRTYTLVYLVASVPNSNGTLKLARIDITGKNGSITTTAPSIRFTYQNKNNRAVTGSDDPYSYPRLISIDNGAGGLLSYTYEDDERGADSWYNYRVKEVEVISGISTAAKQSYAYATPKYSGIGGDPELGSLTGYKTVTEEQLDYADSDAVILSTTHTFGTTGLDTGRELKTEWLQGSTVHRRVTNTYVTDNSQAPFDGWNYRYLYSTLNYERGGGALVLTKKSVYNRDPATGNLLVQFQYLGNTLHKKTYFEYLTNPDPSVYILDTASRVLLTDASGQIVSETRYHYDGRINTAPTLGDVTLTQQRTGVGEQTIDRVVHYNEYGNVYSAKVFPEYGTVNAEPSGTFYETKTKYDETQTYPIETINPLEYKATTDYIIELGLPSKVTDPNLWETTTTYDGLGRTLSVTAPGLNDAGVRYDYPVVANGRIDDPYAVEMQILDTIATPIQYRSVWGIYDGLGRMLQTQVYNADSAKVVVTDSYFNSQGLAYKQSLPYESSSSGGYYISPAGTAFAETTFDFLGRVLTVTQPGNIVSATSYDGLTTTVTDPNGNKVTRTTDGLGRLINVKEYSDPSTVYATTVYSYDSADRLTRVLDAKGNESTIQYDWLGRKIGMSDPDMGLWDYKYNAVGSLTDQTDARGEKLHFEYDPLGRLTIKSFLNGSVFDQISANQYGTTPGGIGMRTSMTDATGTTTWAYDDFGHTVTEHRQINVQSQDMTTVTDWLGRPITVTYPDNETLTYKYDALGRPDILSTGTTNLVDLAYTTLGQIDTQTLGNGVLIDNDYDTANRLRNRLASIGTQNPLNLLHLAYKYDDAGNIRQIIDHKLNETHTFNYDFLNRLTSAEAVNTGNPADYKYLQQFSYDQVGNMTQMKDWIPSPQAYQEPEPSLDKLVSSSNGAEGFGGFHLASLAQQAGETPTPTKVPTNTGMPSPTFTSSPTGTVTPTATVAQSWHFGTTTEGWTAGGSNISGFGWQSGGYIGGTITGAAPIVYSPDNLGINISNNNQIEIRLKNTTPESQARFYFITNSDTTWNGTKSKLFTVTPDSSGYTLYTLDMSSVSGWAGTLKRLRLDPAGSSGSFSVDFVRVGNHYVITTPTFTPPPTSTPTGSPTPSMDQSLKAFWDFNNFTGNTVPDVAPNDTVDNSASLVNGPLNETTGAYLKAMYFDGSNDYATVAHDAVENEIGGANSFTISAWVNPAVTVTNRTQYIVKKGNLSQDYGLVTWSTAQQGTPTSTPTPTGPRTVPSNGSIVFQVGGLTPNMLAGPVLPNNTWTMVTGVYNKGAGEMRLYLNGQLVAAQDVTGTVATSTSPLTFSSNVSTNVYQGRLDEVRYYDRVLNGSEVMGLYGVFTPPLPSPTPTVTVTPTIANIATPLPISQQQWGTGNDGDLIVNSTTFPNGFNINEDKSNGRACADAVAYSVTALGSTSATVNTAPGTCLVPGDEILLIQLTDTAATTYNAGSYEFLRVNNVVGTSVNFSSSKKYWYGNGYRSDSNIGLSEGKNRVMIMRVPNYNNLTVNGTLTASLFDGQKYGVLVFRVAGTLNGSGSIHVNGKGSAIYGAGGNASNTGGPGANGGGGGYQTNGTEGGGSRGGVGGTTFGEKTLNRLFFGSHGGDSTAKWECAPECWTYEGDPVPGGKGGGIVLLIANTISFSGTVSSNGANSPVGYETMYGGAGSGGSIRIEGNTVTLNSLTANGGILDVSPNASKGGDGRIAIYYQTSKNITSSSPAAYTALLGQAPAPTPAPTQINLTPVFSGWGDGSDGNLTVNGTFNVSVNNSGTRTCSDGGDGVHYKVSELSGSWAKLSVTPGLKCLEPGDEIILLHTKGSAPNSGNYEFLKVGGVVDDMLYFTTEKENWYGSGANNDSGIGIDPGDEAVIIQRVPNYNNVTVNGTLKTDNLLIFRVFGTLSGSGTIKADGTGLGGYGTGGNASGNGGPAANGGGGGYLTVGSAGNGSRGGTAGSTFGDTMISKLYSGSNGGESTAYWEDEGGCSYPPCWVYSGGPASGGKGGGIVYIMGKTISFTGNISSNGADGAVLPYGLYGGGGSGGSIRIEGDEVTLNTVSLNGGASNPSPSGQGGMGRAAVYYYTTYSLNFTPGHIQKLSYIQTPAPTPLPEVGASNPGIKGLAAWWTLNQASGTRYDAHGTNNLTDNNTVASASGLKNNAASFVRANQEFLSIDDNPTVSTGDIDFTISANVYLNSKANTAIIANKGAAGNADYRDFTLYFDEPTSKFAFQVGDGATNKIVYSSAPATTGQWYTVTAWHDSVSNTLNIQVNGGSVKSVYYADGALNTAQSMTIGAYSDGTSGLDGLVDEFSLYKRVLTSTERAWLYNDGLGRNYTEVNPPASNPGTAGLSAWWSLNESDGVRADSHASSDLTENNNVSSALGLRGNAALFTAATPVGFLSIADNASISAGDVDFTLSANVYLNSTSSTAILVNKGTVSNANYRDYTLYFDQATSKFVFLVGNSTTNANVFSASAVTTGQWYTVTAWHDSANDKIYIQVNNGAISSANYAGGASNTAQSMTIGAYSDETLYLRGLVDEVVLYKRVLDSAERTWLYNNGLGRTYSDVAVQSGWETRGYDYDEDHVHAVSSVTSDPPSGTSQTSGGSYEYDENGNMTCRIENDPSSGSGQAWFNQVYNAENRIASIQKLTQGPCPVANTDAESNIAYKWDFAYDGDGVRVSTLTTVYDNGMPQPQEYTRYFFGGAYETRDDGSIFKYYNFAGQSIVNEYDPATATWELSYLITDHLGSVVAVTDANGTLTSQQRYYPFGGVRGGLGPISQTDYGYTGQRDLGSDLGLMDYKARFYSPYLNRFVQPDTVIPSPVNPQAFNRYTYVMNSPVNFNDPTGHCYTSSGVWLPGGGDGDCPGASGNGNGGGGDPNPDRDDDDKDTDGDGIPNIPDPDYPLIMPRDHVQADCIPGNLVECFYGTGIMPGGDYEITLSEFLSLMDAINVDVARRDATENYDFRSWYDTPFYDGGRLKSNLCVQLVGCFARNELNYIAQGAASAAAMEGKGMMTLSIVAWKRREYKEWPSVGTFRAAAIGYDYYSMTNAKNYLLLITPLIRNPVPFIDAVQTHCQPITVCLPTP